MTLLRMLMSVFGLLAWLVGLNWSLAAISAPSDIAFCAGLGGIVVLLFVAWLVVRREIKRHFKELGLALAICTLTGCTRIEPGHVGIVVNQWGSDKGVSSYPAVTGAVTYNPISTSVFEYPTYVQTAKWERGGSEGPNEEVCFSTQDKVIVCGDISFSYRLDPAKVPYFYVQFRSDDLTVFTHGFLRNTARGVFNEIGQRYTVQDIMSGKLAEFVNSVKGETKPEGGTGINGQLSKYGVIIEQFDFIGPPRPPANVVESINLTIQATQNAQKVEAELRTTQAEAAKAIAQAEGSAKALLIEAEAQAKANHLLEQSLTPMLVQKQAIEKWDGTLPTYTGGGAMPFIQVK
jgi:regulator of protease activity HflC (stomatin/prohibitin superfamily)